MSEQNSEPSLEEVNAFVAERMRWARLFVTIQEISEDNQVLVHDLSTHDPSVAIPFLASLLTLPDYQTHCIRLEILVVLALIHCRGKKKTNLSQVVRWFHLIGKSQCVTSEDPAEDVFIPLVWDKYGDYRIFNGVWEGAGFYTQRILEIVETMPNEGAFAQIKRSVRALLLISEILCDKAKLQRYQLGSDKRHPMLLPHKLPERNILISRVTVTLDELKKHGIQLSDIEPFLFRPQMRKDMPTQVMNASHLENYPLLLQTNKYLVIALPSALSIAIRDYVIASIIEANLAEVFDSALARTYTRLIKNIRLLGGPIHAPVNWKKAGKHRWSAFVHRVDVGHYISYHLFLPSVQTHVNGGFKTDYTVEEVLMGSLKKSIKDSISNLTEISDFKRGLIVLVGCGWGKGCAMQKIDFDYPQWRFQSMSIADLTRLSYLEDMTPFYFWKIQDGLEVIEKANVQIKNPNGILNLIGWVQSNDGHFVPHVELADHEIPPGEPLIIHPPTNSLRKIRAGSDQSHDRHRSVDHMGTWHDVQRESPNPLFAIESSCRVYSSLDDVRNDGTLTSVYEGRFRLWISVTAPNLIDNKEAEYRLWTMANEWLHRIGAVLDARFGTTAKVFNVKVHIEFRDPDPPKYLSEKPTPESLVPLCTIEQHSELNSCTAVFLSGFLSGFSIAENVAERLFVRHVAKAFLHLLGIANNDDEIKAIETLVVRNSDARSFHIFHAQEFIDYVRDTLPKELITINSIDHASIKVGLGWHAREQNQSNKIEGREECTSFLEKVVEVLLDELIDALAAYDRLSTLRRLVANCEKANAEDKQWERTSAAILGLYENGAQTIEQVVKQISKIAGASAASRILVEIALCACPDEGGIEPSNIEISKLLAYAALVIQMGGLSDAIFYNALPPEITISPLGDILFLDEFGKLVVEPMLAHMTGDRFIDSVPLQKKNYEDPDIVENIEELINGEFLDIWKSEMGFDLYEARDIMGALENKGVKDNNAIFDLTQSEYFALVCSDSVSQKAARSFLNQFSLATRPQWKMPPIGFTKGDIYPWRFARRLSFVAHPILQVNHSDDPTLIIAPSTLRKGVFYVLRGAYYGRFRQSFFHTEEMRNYWKSMVREGHSFNSEVAQKLSNAGWVVRKNIKLPEVFNRKMEHDWGDIDVLAWNPNHLEVLVIECKDLSPARNYSEIAALLSDYQGIEVNGKPDKLKKHLDRVLLLHENHEQLRKFTNIQDLRIVSCLVCSGIVPMQYAKIEALSDMLVGSVEEILLKL